MSFASGAALPPPPRPEPGKRRVPSIEEMLGPAKLRALCYREKNRERLREKARAYYAANRERRRAQKQASRERLVVAPREAAKAERERLVRLSPLLVSR